MIAGLKAIRECWPAAGRSIKTRNTSIHSYCISGLLVDSEVVLPGVDARQAGDCRHDVAIRRSRVPLRLDDASASGPTWGLAGERFLLRVPGIARFLLTGGREIAIEAENETPLEDIAIFLIGTVFGILLHQRGQIVLHASAVRVGGKAVVFCGSSGAGKSTLAASLVQRGFALVTDDVCAISLDGAGKPVVQPDGRQLKLWAQAVDRLGLTRACGAAVRNRLEKFYVEPDQAFGESLPLGAVYALREARPPFSPGISRPNVVDAALLLRRNAYRPLLVNRMGQKTDYFYAAAAMAGSAGIFLLTRQLDFAKMPEVVSWLERHWSEIGLAEKPA